MKIIDNSHLRAVGIFVMQIEHDDSAESINEVLQDCGSSQSIDDVKELVANRHRVEKMAVRVLLSKLMGRQAHIAYTSSGKPIVVVDNIEASCSKGLNKLELDKCYYDVSISHGAGFVVLYIPALSFVCDSRPPMILSYKKINDVLLCDMKLIVDSSCLGHRGIDACDSIGVDIESNHRKTRGLVGRIISESEMKIVESIDACTNAQLLIWCAKETMFKARAGCMDIVRESCEIHKGHEFSYLKDLLLIDVQGHKIIGSAFGRYIEMRYVELVDLGIIIVWNVNPKFSVYNI